MWEYSSHKLCNARGLQWTRGSESSSMPCQPACLHFQWYNIPCHALLLPIIFIQSILCFLYVSLLPPSFSLHSILLTPFLSCIHSFFCLALPTTIYVSLHIYLFSISPSYPLPLPIFPFIPSTFDFVWQESPKEKGLFSILTYVGCGISILCLLASIIFFISLK